MTIGTLNDIFFAAVERNLDKAMLYREGGKWLPISSRDFAQKVTRTTGVLRSWGIQAGDRVAILSENRPEWPIADVSSLLLGAITVPLYTTLTAEQTAFVLSDAGQTEFVKKGFRSLGNSVTGVEVDGANDPSNPCPEPKTLLTM